MRRTFALALALIVVPVVAQAKPTENMTGKRELGMENCPSAVQGAVTRVTNTKEGVVVTVTAKDARGEREVRRRAQIQEEVSAQPARGAIEHTGTGTGSGRYGFCPGAMRNTRLEARDVPGGSQMTVRAAQASDVTKLQQRSHERAEALRVRQ